MPIDPIQIVSLIRQCHTDTDSAAQLLHWLKQAMLLDAQRHGASPSALLVQHLTAEFAPLLQKLASLSAQQTQQLACQQLFSQICHFYQGINNCADASRPTVQKLVGIDSPPSALTNCHHANPAAMTSPQCYNRFD